MKRVLAINPLGVTGMASALLAKMFGGTGAVKIGKTVPSRKSLRSKEEVERLKVAAQLKRDVRAKKRQADYDWCTLNSCNQIGGGKPSQTFLKYVEREFHSMRHSRSVFMVPVHPNNPV